MTKKKTDVYKADALLIGELREDWHEIVLDGKKYWGNTVCVRRSSGYVDEVPIYEVGHEFSEFKKGDNVCVHGILHTFLKRRNGVSKMLVCATSVVASNSSPCNIVNVAGAVCSKPVYRETPRGSRIADLLLAVDYKRGSAYLHSVVWNENAVKCQGLEVGDFVKCTGSFHSRKYLKPVDGGVEERVAYECSFRDINWE